MNKNECEECEVCKTTENVKYYEKSNQNWCEDCAEQIACPECGCWYFAEDGLVCGGCAVEDFQPTKMMNQLKQLCFIMNKSREQSPEFDERHGFQMWVIMRDTPYTLGEIAFGGWNSKDDRDYGKHAFKGDDYEDCAYCGTSER